jgi:hypothetical protein
MGLLTVSLPIHVRARDACGSFPQEFGRYVFEPSGYSTWDSLGTAMGQRGCPARNPLCSWLREQWDRQDTAFFSTLCRTRPFGPSLPPLSLFRFLPYKREAVPSVPYR